MSPNSNPVTAAAQRTAEDADAREVARLRDTRGPVRLGLWVLVIGFGLFLAWAAWVPLEDGVPAPSTVAVESRRTTIQHVHGGRIKAVKVRDGDEVKVGDVLIELDDVQARAVYSAVRETYLAQRALESRLTAELSNAGTISFHPDLLQSTDPEAARHMAVQTQLFNARRGAHAAAVSAQEQVIVGMQSQIDGLQQMLAARAAQQSLQTRQFEAVQRLAEESFAPRNQALQLAQAQADLRTTVANLQTEQMRLRGAQAEARLRLAGMRQEYVKELSTQMADVQREVQANHERMLAAEQDLSQMTIKAPAAGQVIGLMVHNTGGVVEPSRPLMDILPLGVPLVLDVRVPPQVIDTVAPGQEVEVRFAAFASTPHLVVMGRLSSVSGDVLTEQTVHGTMSYYPARAELTPEGMRALGGRTVQPGMTADVLVRSGSRSMLQYLLGPLRKRVATALTER